MRKSQGWRLVLSHLFPLSVWGESPLLPQDTLWAAPPRVHARLPPLAAGSPPGSGPPQSAQMLPGSQAPAPTPQKKKNPTSINPVCCIPFLLRQPKPTPQKLGTESQSGHRENSNKGTQGAPVWLLHQRLIGGVKAPNVFLIPAQTAALLWDASNGESKFPPPQMYEHQLHFTIQLLYPRFTGLKVKRVKMTWGYCW